MALKSHTKHEIWNKNGMRLALTITSEYAFMVNLAGDFLWKAEKNFRKRE